MAVIVRQNIVSPTSENIKKIEDSEKELIAVMGIEKFREMGLNDSVFLCKRLVSYVSKFANEDQKVQIKAIFPDDKGLDSIAQACLKMRALINLNVLPDSEEAQSCVDQFEESIVEMIEEPLDFSRTLTCEMAVDRGDLEMLKRLKKLNRGWSQDLAEYAKNNFDFLCNQTKAVDTVESKKRWDEKVKKASEILEWVNEELKKGESP